MTLDEAIKHCEEVSMECEASGKTQCSLDHRQLMNWLIELKQLRAAANK